MELSLQGVSHKVGAQQHLYPMDLRLVPNAVTVLLGATQAGKTTLMRLMAGLDRPSEGTVMVDGTDVTGWPVRQRESLHRPSRCSIAPLAPRCRVRRSPTPMQRRSACSIRLPPSRISIARSSAAIRSIVTA